MAKAIIELINGRSLSARGRTLKKGYPQTITDLADIYYYQGVSSVKVRVFEDVLEETEKPRKQTKKIIKESKKAQVTEELFKNEELEFEEPEETEEEAEKPKEQKKEVVYSFDELRTKKKKALIDIAASLGIFVEENERRKTIIESILNAQK